MSGSFFVHAAGRIKAPTVRLRDFGSAEARVQVYTMSKPPTPPLNLTLGHTMDDDYTDDPLVIGFVWLLVNAVADIAVLYGRAECEREVRELLQCNHSRAVAIVADARLHAAFRGHDYYDPLPAALSAETVEHIVAYRADDKRMRVGLQMEDYADVSRRLFVYVATSPDDSGEHNPDEMQEEPLHPEYSRDAELAYDDEMIDNSEVRENTKKKKKEKVDDEDEEDAAPGGRSDVFGLRTKSIHPIAFKRLAMEIVGDYGYNINIDCRAMALLQDAAEHFMAEHMDDDFRCLPKVEAACAAHGGGCACRVPKRKRTYPTKI
jgi:hypothetical protein